MHSYKNHDPPERKSLNVTLRLDSGKSVTARLGRTLGNWPGSSCHSRTKGEKSRTVNVPNKFAREGSRFATECSCNSISSSAREFASIISCGTFPQGRVSDISNQQFQCFAENHRNLMHCFSRSSVVGRIALY
jgi:hypothetical protein